MKFKGYSFALSVLMVSGLAQWPYQRQLLVQEKSVNLSDQKDHPFEQYPALFPASTCFQIAHEHLKLRCQRLERLLDVRHPGVNIQPFSGPVYRAF